MTDNATLMALSADIVASYVEANKLSPAELPDLIRTVYAALDGGTPTPIEAPPPEKLTAARIRKSITPDLLVSFEDGQGYRMLKRHLTKLGLTPADYRQKWGLPNDYPMTAPSYSATRSALAKRIGLGRKAAGGTKLIGKARSKKASEA
jgi:predicted transcriptional regulator